MTPEQATALRAEFPASAIGKLPKPTKKENPKGKCSECGGWHGLPAVHLDYVGHAATTDRLLHVDPDWTWEPMAYGAGGEPMFTNGGLWIWLTVAGVKRPGFGDGTSPKEIIGDAIRNAAMRFGVALDLWAKEDLHGVEGVDAPTPSPAPVSVSADDEPGPFDPPPGATDKPTGPKAITQPQYGKIGALMTELSAEGKVDVPALRAFTNEQFGKTSRKELTSVEASAVIEWLMNKQAGLPEPDAPTDSDIPF